jgi:hypothetical protein
MAFLTPIVWEVVAGNLVRGTGGSVAAGVTGTIGLDGDATADSQLPGSFKPRPYGDATLSDSIEANPIPTAAGAAAQRLSVAKTEGPFQIAITNDDGVNDSAVFEIFVRFH